MKKTTNLLRRIKRKVVNILKWKSNLNKILAEQNNKIIELEQQLLNEEIKFNEKINDLEEDILNLENIANYNFDENVDSIYYFHSGSNNCGCEALVKTITKLSGNKAENSALISYRRKEDFKKNINKYTKYIIKPTNSNITKKIEYMGDCKFSFEDLGIESYLKNLKKDTIAYSIGGDNYCYGDYVNKLLAQHNKLFHKYKIKTALLGCSIEPSVIKNKTVQKDLNLYDLIIARESITYETLINEGIDKNTKLIPDTAFVLEKEEVSLPAGFQENNTVGINISPLINSFTSRPENIYNNYKKLMEYILNNSNMSIALIAHVYWEKSNDLEPIEKLYNEFCNSDRICIVKDNNASKLKGYISKCKIFVGARTHAIIAAYSTCVPTLAVGYSVKSKGIAKDLFGNYKNYVISVDDFDKDDNLLKAYKYIEDNYDNIREYLKKTIPEYIKPLKKYKELINQLKEIKLKEELPTDDCSGCSACLNICPKKCISFEENEEGFKYPIINYKECIKCGKCLKVCPSINKKEAIIPTCLAVQASDKIRLQSSSGGVFYHLAEKTLNNSGVVVGAAFDENMRLKHQIIDNKKDINKLQGSKYLQSDINNIYQKVKQLLNKKTLVLLSGTPCQIKGLKMFLGKEYENLYTIDVVCHGVPSPLVYRKYIEKLENKNDSKVVKYNFRNKDISWHEFSTKIEYSNNDIQNEKFSDNIYMKGFLRNLYLRKSCYNCQANKFTSGSDITLGDFWGIKDIMPEFDDNKGTSLVFINTKKGQDLFDSIEKKFKTKKVNAIDVVKYNKSLYMPAFANKNRSKFFNNFENIDIEENINNNLYDEV